MKEDMDILKNDNKLKDNPFTVPEGYFDAMRLRSQKMPEILETKARKLRRTLIPVFSAAASVVLIVCGMLLFDGRRGVSEKGNYFESTASLSSDEIIEYLIYTGTSVEDINAAGDN